MKKKLILILLSCFCFVVFILLTYTQDTVLHSSRPVRQEHLQELVALGISSLETNDVPVSSLILYGRSIIGKGHNTVLRDSNAGGHAEINAISDAILNLGFERFSELNRDSLALLSTFEPCAMCRGAILEYNIRYIEYLKDKPLLHLLKEDARYLRYLWRRKKREPSTLQDSLFQLHPTYSR